MWQARRQFCKALIVTAVLGVLALKCMKGRQGGFPSILHVEAHPHKTSPPRILTYITTHLSSQHYAYLEGCWPKLLKALPIFKESDFMMFVTAEPGRTNIDMDLIHSVFARPGITVQVRPNPGWQEGASLALAAAYENRWFEGYDWVIRLNPDVIIRDDSFLRQAMANDSITGIFSDCLDQPCPAGQRCMDRQIHTDFFAIRPGAVSRERVLEVADKHASHAESMATKAFSGIVRNGSDAWLPGTGPHEGFCRVRGKLSPVVHDHAGTWACMTGNDGITPNW